MARFKKQRVRRKPDYTERCVNAGKSMLIDYSLGYNPSPTTYKVDKKEVRA